MQRRASIRWGPTNASRRAGVEAARAASAMLPSVAGASGCSSRLVRITPRNSQLPCSRLTRLVCLPCQPIPAACASGFSITGAVSTNTFSSRRHLIDDEPRERLQRLLDRLVIVAALRIGRDTPEFRMRRQRQRVGRRRIAHAERDRRLRFWPERQRRHAVMRALLHPAHRPVMPGLEPALEVEPGRVRRIGAREAARGETQPLRLGSYCFLKAFVGSHGSHYTARPELVEGLPLISVGITVLRQAQHVRSDEGLAVEAVDLVKDFGETRAVDGVSLAVPDRRRSTACSAPTAPARRRPCGCCWGSSIRRAERAACSAASGRSRRRREIGYLPEERGLYPAMTPREAIAFMGALRGLPLSEGRRGADELLEAARPRRLGEEADPHTCPRAWRRPCSSSAPSSTSRA